MLSYSAVPPSAAVLSICWSVGMLAGCTKAEDRVAEEGAIADTATTAQVSPGSSARISLADVAGKWKMRSTDESGGNVVEVELTATADGSDWIIVGPNRPPVRERIVAVAGDSIVAEAGPYESFIRKGVQVRTRDVYRLRNGRLVSTFEARYAMRDGDSVAQRHSEGTRVQYTGVSWRTHLRVDHGKEVGMPTLSPATAAGQTEATHGIDRARELIDAAWTRSDADGITRYLAEDAVLLPPHDSPKTDRDAIKTWLREFFTHYRMTDLTMPERQVSVSGNLAVEASRYQWKLVPTAGGPPIVDDVNWIGIWERRGDGEWREVRGMWNSRLEQ